MIALKIPKKCNYIFLAVLAGSIIMLFIGMASEVIPLLGAGLFLAFGSFVFRAITFRCPDCGYYLGRGSGTYCPRCKKEID